MGRTRMLAMYEPRDHLIVGSADHVATVLRTATLRGRLLTTPDEVARGFRRLPDGRIEVRVRMLTPLDRPLPPRRPGWLVPVGVALVAGSALWLLLILVARVIVAAGPVAWLALALGAVPPLIVMSRRRAARGCRCVITHTHGHR